MGNGEVCKFVIHCHEGTKKISNTKGYKLKERTVNTERSFNFRELRYYFLAKVRRSLIIWLAMLSAVVSELLSA